MESIKQDDNDSVEKIRFSEEEIAIIQAYQKVSGATTLKNAIMDAVTLELGHTDDNDIIDAISSILNNAGEGMKYILETEDKPLQDNNGKKLYRAKGFSALVFDDEGLKRLTPYDESEAEMRGAKKAWEMVYKLWTPFGEGGMSPDELKECFNSTSLIEIAKMPYQEVAEKYEAWTKKHDEIRVGDEIENLAMIYEKGIVVEVDEKMARGFNLAGRYYFNWNREDIRKTGRRYPEIEEFMRKMREAE